ncbi:hypothetical protein [Saccharopolyspora sp. 6M]|uniref:hypothetical protein n=1 Tax=Saccharopolyspora sp. 6M TaxID=2877237 RepID=UPI001CD6F99F|nr:hypothetical protein [Saccharopolyspora sp. 6M]MCA1229398.1 hypothetical protein [Saccharopolyspora sp. 6M]
MQPAQPLLLDGDHVVLHDGRIVRVLGNLDSSTHFLGYNVYSPASDGDRLYRGRRYLKNFLEDTRLPDDVLDTYELIDRDEIFEHHDPLRVAPELHATLDGTVWARLHDELAGLFGHEAVGIFGSALLRMHLNAEGKVRKDVDYLIHGDLATTVPALADHLPHIRRELGFTTITPERQHRQQRRYSTVFRHPHNSLAAIIARRWAGLQLSRDIVTTIRFRDPTHLLSFDVATTPTSELDEETITGIVTHAPYTATFPPTFTVTTNSGEVEISVFWWKFATPVRKGDAITARGSVLPSSRKHQFIRITHFDLHYLNIHETTPGEPL